MGGVVQHGMMIKKKGRYKWKWKKVRKPKQKERAMKRN